MRGFSLPRGCVMKRGLQLVVLLGAIMCGLPAWPQTAAPPISLHFNPGILFPLGESATYFRMSPAAGLSARFRLPGGLSFLFAKAGLEYGYTPIVGAAQSLSMIAIGGGGGVALDIGALILSRCQVETNYPRPSTDPSNAIGVSG